MAVFLPAQNEDDASTYSVAIYLTGANIAMGSPNPLPLPFDAGVRFANITISKKSTILSAKVTFQAYSAGAGETCKVRIKGEAADDPATFSTKANFDNRAKTTEYMDWTIPVWTIDTDYDSPDIKNIIQEIVDRPGWVRGNHLILFFPNNGSTAYATRSPKAYDTSTTLCARLTITYTVRVPRHGFVNFQNPGIC